MEFGEKLQLLRRKSGWTQEELARKINVSRQAVSKWEISAVKPDIYNVLELSRLFGVSTDCLLKDELSLPFVEISATYEDIPSVGDGGGDVGVPIQEPVRQRMVGRIIAGSITLGIGVLGIVVLGVFSSLSNHTIWEVSWTGAERIVRTGFFAFLEATNLIWLFILCVFTTFFGVATLISIRMRAIVKAIKQWLTEFLDYTLPRV